MPPHYFMLQSFFLNIFGVCHNAYCYDFSPFLYEVLGKRNETLRKNIRYMGDENSFLFLQINLLYDVKSLAGHTIIKGVRKVTVIVHGTYNKIEL